MKLYHYTSYKTFKLIWNSQKLKFGDCKKVNDFLESDKSLSAPLISLDYDIYGALENCISEYKQISLAKDFNENKKGYMSPILWSHYADKNRGVCIEFDYEKLMSLLPKNCKAGEIEYVLVKKPTAYKNYSIPEISSFVEHNINDIFFKKLDDWQAENEFRIICNDPSIEFLDIKGAITAIYITKKFHPRREMSRKCKQLEKLIENPDLVHLFWYTQRSKYLEPIARTTRGEREVALKNKEFGKLYEEKQKRLNQKKARTPTFTNDTPKVEVTNPITIQDTLTKQ